MLVLIKKITLNSVLKNNNANQQLKTSSDS